MSEQVAPEELYRRFIEFLNGRQYDQMDTVMVSDFVDHHPGLVDVANLQVYKDNVAYVIGALEMEAFPEHIVPAGDKVFTRVRLTGKHVGQFFGVPPSGNQLEWYTHELWRVEGGKMVERWAVDDLYSLLKQMGVALPSW
ncbi:MAG: ester cyclase [Actinobacteria bacterium]|nr:MAG: ester cyclase [Actinomycetota bacterium]